MEDAVGINDIESVVGETELLGIFLLESPGQSENSKVSASGL